MTSTRAAAPSPDTAATTDVMVLPHAAASVPDARAHLSARLRHLPDELLEDTLLVLSELLGNAVRHTPVSTGDVEVRWAAAPGAVDLEVVDGGGGEPLACDRGEDAVSGRGLAIVDALSQSWGSRALESGRCSVWSRIAAS